MCEPALIQYPVSELAQSLLSAQRRAMRYEEPSTVAAALCVIPVERLRAAEDIQPAATQRCRSASPADQTADPPGGQAAPSRSPAAEKPVEKPTEKQAEKSAEDASAAMSAAQRDQLLYRLLVWFKDDFFRWFEPPVCRTCDVQMVLRGQRQVSPVVAGELAYHAEQYSCRSCAGVVAEFLRYNHPAKLLHTRVGRCGEWANCFALCCRALGFATRFVEDSKDHVWTEVYSEAERRWLHVDPCERALDRPSIYEAGWGKQLDYVFAYSCDEVSDVTFRYSVDHPATVARRRTYREDHLARVLVDVNTWLQRALPKHERHRLSVRRVTELVQLLRPPPSSTTGAPGRQSGSLAWRLARGETRPAAADFVFRPTERERRARRLHWSYSVLADRYVRGSTAAAGWASCAYRADGVQRKEERDWRMVYLCRAEGVASAHVGWRVDVRGSALVVDRVRVVCASTEFHSGRVRWTLSGDGGGCVRLPGDGAAAEVTQLAGSCELTLAARLDGGHGEHAFQHGQVLRASLDGPDALLEITVWLKEAE